jgi:tRNA dimethylallyltransferase
MRSLGYRQLLDHLEGQLSLADAVAAIKRDTRHYARRQRTYFRSQLGGTALRVSVAEPLWEPAVDLSEVTGAWLPRVQQFLSGASP